MSNKIPNKSYIILLSISVVITFCSFFVQESRWNTIVASIGASGIASVCVAWLIDARATKIRVIDNKAKADELTSRFLCLALFYQLTDLPHIQDQTNRLF